MLVHTTLEVYILVAIKGQIFEAQSRLRNAFLACMSF